MPDTLKPRQILQKMGELKTKAEMIAFLRNLPRKDIEWPREEGEKDV